jgi:hypothetical protein
MGSSWRRLMLSRTPLSRVWHAILRPSAGIVLSCSLIGCSNAFRPVHSSSELGRGQRLLFGEVIAEQSPLSQYVTLLYDKAEVVFDRTLPDYGRHSYADFDSIGETGDIVDRHGGAFAVAAPQSDVYLLALRIRGTGVAQTIRFVPLHARIASTRSKCVYIGTIVLHSTESGVTAEIRDDLDGALRRNHGAVSACEFYIELAERVPPHGES